MAPIKVRGRFATAYDTAETLGVSPSRARELIKTARALTARVVQREAGTDEFISEHGGRRVSARRKSNRTNASKAKARARRAKSAR